mmetsp:Transcript_1756/g.5674  ORF Transcript_1756/g.5674 Transcript_1756/m.5674 type:complete len:200 (+) Transcript_1756:29-628(+)
MAGDYLLAVEDGGVVVVAGRVVAEGHGHVEVVAGDVELLAGVAEVARVAGARRVVLADALERAVRPVVARRAVDERAVVARAAVVAAADAVGAGPRVAAVVLAAAGARAPGVAAEARAGVAEADAAVGRAVRGARDVDVRGDEHGEVGPRVFDGDAVLGRRRLGGERVGQDREAVVGVVGRDGGHGEEVVVHRDVRPQI